MQSCSDLRGGRHVGDNGDGNVHSSIVLSCPPINMALDYLLFVLMGNRQELDHVRRVLQQEHDVKLAATLRPLQVWWWEGRGISSKERSRLSKQFFCFELYSYLPISASSFVSLRYAPVSYNPSACSAGLVENCSKLLAVCHVLQRMKSTS